MGIYAGRLLVFRSPFRLKSVQFSVSQRNDRLPNSITFIAVGDNAGFPCIIASRGHDFLMDRCLMGTMVCQRDMTSDAVIMETC